MPKSSAIITRPLIEVLRAQFALEWTGIHGSPHWARVRENGLRLASETGANARVIELFAFLHDSQRLDDWEDPGHGERAAEFALTLRGSLIQLSDAEFELLHLACTRHSDGGLDADVTVQCCWDADRLDLGRVGIKPLPEKLCTSAARELEVIEWAYTRSLRE